MTNLTSIKRAAVQTTLRPRRAAAATLLGCAALPAIAYAQTMSPPVPESEVFTPAQIGRALSPPTPNAGKTAPSLVNAPADDGQWTMPSKNYASTRYSAQAEINASNVATLKPVFTFPLGVPKGQEAAPIVAGHMMFVVTAYPNLVYAFDLTKPGAKPLWTYTPDVMPAAQGVACCDVVNRGGTFSRGKYIFNTLDGQTVALDARTGKAVWKVKLGDINKGETMTMAPLVARGKVYVGDSGGEMGVRGWMIALDEATGKQVWKAYGTGPDQDVLIGASFKPFYASERGKNLGVTSWPTDAWKIGGATGWGWMTYDPELNQVYNGTGNPGPWNAEQRPGDNKWTAGIFARNPDTGQAKWYYGLSPHDEHDYDGVNEQILLDMPFGGKMRKVLVRPDRNGYVYVVDRYTGQVLSADPFGPTNSSKGVDLTTGRLIKNPEKGTTPDRETKNICPTASGAKDWNPSSFSPRTGLLYIPHENMCMDWLSLKVNYISGTPYVGAEVHMKPGPGGNRGQLAGWDPVLRKPAWLIKEELPIWSGTVATGGDLVFYGTMDGLFKAVDARTGKLLWSFKADSGIIGQPISYKGPDGHQYIAVLSGVGGWAGAVVSGPVDKRDGTAALGMVNAMSDLDKYTKAGGTLYVFSLPR